MTSSSAAPIKGDVLFSSKEKLSTHLDLLNQKTLIIGKEPLILMEKLDWVLTNKKLPNSFSFESIKCFESFEKNKMLEQLTKYLLQFNLPSRLVELILSTTDELLMNAFFDAPVDNGKVIFKDTPRYMPVTTSNPVELIMGNNGEEIAIAVVDQFGSVNQSSIIKHLKKTFVNKDYIEPVNGTGAGIGLSLCVKRNASLFIKVDPTVQSQFTVFFPIVDSFKSYLEKSQIISVHIKKS